MMKITNDFDASKPDGTLRKLMDVGRLKAMGWKAKTEMREGVAVAHRDFFGSPVWLMTCCVPGYVYLISFKHLSAES